MTVGDGEDADAVVPAADVVGADPPVSLLGVFGLPAGV